MLEHLVQIILLKGTFAASDFREKVDEVREKLEKLVARTSSSLGSRIDRARKDGVQNKEDIAAVRFEVSRAKANSREDEQS